MTEWAVTPGLTGRSEELRLQGAEWRGVKTEDRTVNRDLITWAEVRAALAGTHEPNDITVDTVLGPPVRGRTASRILAHISPRIDYLP